MSKPRIARRQIAAAHLASTDRGARVLAACDGDAEHATRIVDELERRAPVVHLPRPYDYACDVDESAGLAGVLTARDREPILRFDEFAVGGRIELRWWALAGALGLLCWVVLAAAAYGVYRLVEAFT